MLSPVYLETADFDADPGMFREIKRRGNIKAALRDGVFVAEVIAQKLAGKTVIDVALEFEDDAVAGSVASGVPTITPSAKTQVPAAARTDGAAPRLVRLLPGNVEADEFVLKRGSTTIGRVACDVTFADDSLLSDRHASIVEGPDGYVLRDEGSAAGLFLRLTSNVPVDFPKGSIIRAGSQWIVRSGDRTLTHYSANGTKVTDFPLRQATLVAGREAPDWTLDPKDGSLSRRHFSVTTRDGKVSVNDLGSANGTLFKVSTPVKLRAGDQIVLGGQVLQFTLPTTAIPSSVVRSKTASGVAAPVAEPVPAEKVDGPAVTFRGVGKTCPIRKDQTICQVAEANGITLQADCHQGICGSDPIRIEGGAEFLTKMSDVEKATLEDICSVSPTNHRLACMARATGPVEVEIP